MRRAAKTGAVIPAIVLAALVATWAPAHAGDLFVTTEIVASGFLPTTYLTTAPGDTQRLFVAERRGWIRIIKNGKLLETPFLDIDALVNSGGPERAFAAIAFHPGYETNGFFFVSYTDVAGDGVIARFTVSADPDLADPKSQLVLLTIEEPAPIHNVGWLGFGPDGYLYVGSGDGGGTDGEFAQDTESLLGKLLRIDVDGPPPYGIPPGNPFVGRAGLDEIWALGLRNPWRCSFDRKTGDLWLGDVGKATWEEVNFQPAGTPGVNYGWNCREGAHCAEPAKECCKQPGLTDPIHEYEQAVTCAVIGGYVYRGTAIPALTGLYLFADWCANRVWAFDRKTGEATEILDNIPSISSFGEDGAGELYLLSSGTVRKIVPDDPPDCNGNQIPDPQDIENGTSQDCNTNGVPDECEPDCNGNTVPDDCDIADGTSKDDNSNGIPDECDVNADLDGDGVVGIGDLLILFAAWGVCGDCDDCPADLNDDCSVGIPDLLILFARWGGPG